MRLLHREDSTAITIMQTILALLATVLLFGQAHAQPMVGTEGVAGVPWLSSTDEMLKRIPGKLRDICAEVDRIAGKDENNTFRMQLQKLDERCTQVEFQSTLGSDTLKLTASFDTADRLVQAVSAHQNAPSARAASLACKRLANTLSAAFGEGRTSSHTNTAKASTWTTVDWTTQVTRVRLNCDVNAEADTGFTNVSLRYLPWDRKLQQALQKP